MIKNNILTSYLIFLDYQNAIIKVTVKKLIC